MIEAIAGKKAGEKLTVLCLGAHSDDIEIGCGGTILRLLEENAKCSVHWVVLSGGGQREKEARSSAMRFLKMAKKTSLELKTFRDSFFPHFAVEIKEFFETLKGVNPDVIFTHHSKDLHQDHRLVHELTWNTFRSHTILEYEIPKYDGDLGQPNVFIALKDSVCKKKVDLILKGFPTQRSKRWFTAETFSAVLRIRGIEAGVDYAEGFHCRKLVLSV